MKYASPALYNKAIVTSYDKTLGYLVFLDKEHPLSTEIGRVYFHRHLLSMKIGRWLTTEEHTHHVDGDKLNNRYENLMLLSREEHAALHNTELETKVCILCNKEYKPDKARRKYCSDECARKATKRFEISKEVLEKLVWAMPTVAVAEKYGVSDKAIEKRCKKFKIEKPPRGYWAKKQAGKC